MPDADEPIHPSAPPGTPEEDREQRFRQLHALLLQRRRRTGLCQDQEDDVQEALCRVLQRMPGAHAPAELRAYALANLPWLRADRAAARTARPLTQMPAPDAEPEDPREQGPLEALLAREEGARVAAALARMPARDRKLLEKRFRRGRSFRELASQLGCTAEAARSSFRRALETFASVFLERRKSPPGPGL